MLLKLVLVAVVVTVSIADGPISSSSSSVVSSQKDLSIDSLFRRWIERHGKNYGDDNDELYQYRRQIFADNANIVAQHNQAYELQLTSYAMSLDGPFADLTADEFRSSYLMTPQNCSATHISSGQLIPPTTTESRLPAPRIIAHKNSTDRKLQQQKSSSLPTSVDWRTKGIMTPIKNQGHCGSCWTFSTTGTLEAHTCLANKNKRDCTHWTGLAEQQLVDCAGNFNNNGCDGGLPSQAFEYIKYNGGIMTEDSYVYKAEDGKCSWDDDRKSVGATVDGVFNITSLDEEQLVWAIAMVGPVSVAYDVADDFRFYSHGVYDSFNATTNTTACAKDSGHVNHAVVAVGYGETMEKTGASAVPFFIIRNSWGNAWGMEGHFWMKRGENMCGVSDCASFPLVSGASVLAPTEKSYQKTKSLRQRKRFDDPFTVAV